MTETAQRVSNEQSSMTNEHVILAAHAVVGTTDPVILETVESIRRLLASFPDNADMLFEQLYRSPDVLELPEYIFAEVMEHVLAYCEPVCRENPDKSSGPPPEIYDLFRNYSSYFVAAGPPQDSSERSLASRSFDMLLRFAEQYPVSSAMLLDMFDYRTLEQMMPDKWDDGGGAFFWDPKISYWLKESWLLAHQEGELSRGGKIAALIWSAFGVDVHADEIYEHRFAQYAARHTFDEMRSFKELVEKYGFPAFRTLLSLMYNEAEENAARRIGEKLPPEVAMKIFEKNMQILNAEDHIEEYLRDGLPGGPEEHTLTLVDIRLSLFARSKALFAECAPALESVSDKAETYEALSSRILEALGDINKDKLMLLSSLKILHDKEIPVDLNDLEGIDVRGAARSEDLTQDEITDMRAIYMANYAHMPELRDALVKKFDECVAPFDPGNTLPEKDNRMNRFYLLKHKDEQGDLHVKSFFRLESVAPRDDSNKQVRYFGAFNVAPDYRGSAVGDMMMDQYLEWIAQGDILDADCDLHAPVTVNYIERGFVGIRKYALHEIDALAITRNDERATGVFESKSWDEEEIFRSARDGEDVEIDGGRFVIAVRLREDVEKLPFDLLDKKDGGMRCALTRYLYARTDKNEPAVCAVFERVSEEDFDMFMNR